MKTLTRRRIPAAWLSLLFGLFSLGLFAAFTLYQEYRNMGHQELNRLQTQAAIVGNDLGLQLGGINRGLSDLLAEAGAGPPDLAQLNRLLKIYSDSVPTVNGMVLLDSRGAVAASGWTPSPTDTDPRHKLFDVPFSRMDPDRLYLSAPASAPAAARVFADKTGAFRWAAVAYLNSEYLRELLDSVRYRSDILVRFQIDGTTVLQLPERTAADRDFSEIQRTVADPGFVSNQRLTISVSADNSAVFGLWTWRLIDYMVLFSVFAGLSAGLLAVLQRRQKRFDRIEQENSERLRMAYEAAEVGVWEYEVGRKFMNWQENMFRLHGLNPEHYASTTQAWESSLLPEDLPRAEDFLQSVRNADRALTAKLRFRTEDGQVRIFRTMAKGFPDRTGQCVRVVGIHQDITQTVEDQTSLKQLNLELKQVNAELKQRTVEAEAASLSKSRFLANMSHEIRTPMNAVLGLLTILGTTPLDRRQRDYVQKAEASGNFLLTLLNDILDFSKAEAGKLELEYAEFPLHSVLNDVAAIMATMTSGKPVEVIFDVSPHLPQRVIGDSFRLHQILLNLGSNAVKFTAQGTVTVRVEASEAAGGQVSLDVSVADTGIGIAEEKLADIFQGFVQAETSTTRRFGGSGLGLSICRFLIEKMGGRLRVDSRLGQGSRFSFSVTLKAAEGDTRPLRGDRRIGSLRFLVVENNDQTRAVLTRTLETLGWSAEAAESIDDALARLSAGSVPDVLLVDAGLLRLGGDAFAAAVKTLPASAKVVLLTNLVSRESDLRRTLLWDGQVTKPVTPSALVDLVEGLFLRDAENLAPAAPAARRLEGRRILIVEDNPVNRLVARELLEQEGAQTAVATGGAAALDELARGGFDCILMDLQMPEMDGFETTRRIRARYGSGPFIVAVTANALPSDRDACLEAGMDNHVGKPLELERLVKTILQGKPAGTAEAPAVVEWETALSRLNGDRVLFRRVIENFLSAGTSLMTTLATPAAPVPVDERRRAAHTLKGLAATVGATALSREAARLEELSRDGSPLDVRALQRTWAEVQPALKRYLSSQEGGDGPDRH